MRDRRHLAASSDRPEVPAAGARLPSEELIGREPAAGAATRRAYLSNVCVPIAARRQVRF